MLAKIIDLLLNTPNVELLVADFEEGLWRGAKSVIGEMKIYGCAFYWGQTVWRHVQELGLQVKLYLSMDMYCQFER